MEKGGHSLNGVHRGPTADNLMSLPHRGPILSSPAARGSLHGGHYLGDVHHARMGEASSGAGDYHPGIYHSEQTSPGLSMRGSVGPSPLIGSSRVSRQPSPSRSPHRSPKRNPQTPKPPNLEPYAQCTAKGSESQAPQLHTKRCPEPTIPLKYQVAAKGSPIICTLCSKKGPQQLVEPQLGHRRRKGALREPREASRLRGSRLRAQASSLH